MALFDDDNDDGENDDEDNTVYYSGYWSGYFNIYNTLIFMLFMPTAYMADNFSNHTESEAHTVTRWAAALPKYGWI